MTNRPRERVVTHLLTGAIILPLMILVILLGGAPCAIYAQDTQQPQAQQQPPSLFVSMHEPGSLSISMNAGWAWGVSLGMNAEWFVARWTLLGVPFDIALSAKGVYEGIWYTSVGLNYWSAAPMVTVHTAISAVGIDLFTGVGVAFFGYFNYGDVSGAVISTAFATFSAGLAFVLGGTWYFTPGFGITAEIAIMGENYFWGAGIAFSL